ncbi:MAG: ATP-binding protein [Lachnospiraceae bacterium]|nr:ATP-binding protein [Lachnospiraceae bacterium]
MQKLIMLSGLPACGKSTLAKKYREEGYAVVSIDSMRRELFGDINQQSGELTREEFDRHYPEYESFYNYFFVGKPPYIDGAFMSALAQRMIADALKNGKDVVYDATNLAHRKEFFDAVDALVAGEAEYQKYLMYKIMDIDTVLERSLDRINRNYKKVKQYIDNGCQGDHPEFEVAVTSGALLEMFERYKMNPPEKEDIEGLIKEEFQ